MKRLALGMAAALTLAACGGGGSGQASPTAAATTPRPAVAATTTAPATAAATAAAPTPAAQIKFTADLKPENEVPPIASEEKSGSGKGTFTLDLTRDSSGKITAAKATFDVTLTGFPTTTQIVLFHIHNGPAGQNAGVVVDSGQKSTEPVTLTTGSATIKKSDITVAPDLADSIIANPAGHYFNVHSKLHGGGVVRGQLVKS